MLPNGVPAGTGSPRNQSLMLVSGRFEIISDDLNIPVGPVPVLLELNVGATVRVDVYALSRVELTSAPVALRHMMLTEFLL